MVVCLIRDVLECPTRSLINMRNRRTLKCMVGDETNLKHDYDDYHTCETGFTVEKNVVWFREMG